MNNDPSKMLNMQTIRHAGRQAGLDSRGLCPEARMKRESVSSALTKDISIGKRSKKQLVCVFYL